MNMYICVCIYIYIYIYMYTCPSIHPSTHPSIYPSIYLSIYLSIFNLPCWLRIQGSSLTPLLWVHPGACRNGWQACSLPCTSHPRTFHDITIGGFLSRHRFETRFSAMLRFRPLPTFLSQSRCVDTSRQLSTSLATRWSVHPVGPLRSDNPSSLFERGRNDLRHFGVPVRLRCSA